MLIEKGVELIYLFGEKFIIPGDVGGIKYIGVNSPKIDIEGNVLEADIDFQSLKVDIDDYIGFIGNADSVAVIAKKFFDRSNKNKELAVNLLRISAENGSAKSQLILSKCYEEGFGVEKNVTEQVKWIKKAARQEYAPAENILGNCYYYGDGVEKNYPEAVKWYRKAAVQGNKYSQNQLGDCYYYGNGVEKNYPEAIKWYIKAAEQGYSKAQSNLGNCYYYGNGVEKNYPEAVKWYRKAADQGYAKAQEKLGTCYLMGYGVEIDIDQALDWYLEMDKNRYAKKAVAQCRSLANQGDAEAQCKLGLFYYYGIGVEENKEEAGKWISKSSEQNNWSAFLFIIRGLLGQ